MRFFAVVAVGYIVVGMGWGGEGYESVVFLRNLLCAIGSWNLEIICGVA